MLVSNFEIQKEEFVKFLELLNENKLLKHIVIAGSWAEYIYSNGGLLKGFDPNLKTLDADFLIKNQRHPNPPANIVKIAKDAGYVVSFDILYETTKIFTPSQFEIEFLINQMGSGTNCVLDTNLGVKAQALRHMDISLRNTISIDFCGMEISVPLPEAYVIHKMVINEDRKLDKQAKDVNSIFQLAAFLDKDVYDDIYASLFKKEKIKVDKFLLKYGDIFDIDNVERLLAMNTSIANESVSEIVANAVSKCEEVNKHCSYKNNADFVKE